MTDPKKPTPSEQANTTPGTTTSADREVRLLNEIADLAASVKRLAERPPGAPYPGPPAPEPSDPAAEQRRTVQFGYTLLGELLVRRRRSPGQSGSGEPIFRSPRVDAARSAKTITFTGDLRGATVAEVRAGEITEQPAITDSTATLERIADTAPIDSIMLRTGVDGEPVAIGRYLPASPYRSRRK